MSYDQVREEMRKEGLEITRQEYEDGLNLAVRKAACAGKDSSYIPLLLPDVIRQIKFSNIVNAMAELML